jgi:hypothetical protein
VPRRSRRGGGTVLVLLVVIAGLLVAADITARVVAQNELANRVEAAVPTARTATARVRSFPFLGRLLASGRVSEVDATVTDVSVEGLRFKSIAVDLHGVQLDRDQLVRDRRIVLEKLDRGLVEARVTQEALSEVLGVSIDLEEGRASVTIAGRRVGADLEVRDGHLVVEVAGLSLPTIRAEAPLLPCLADARIVVGRVLLLCEFTEIPEELRAPAEL